MSLARGIGTATEQPGGDVLFPMKDGLLRIRCRVTADALYRLTGGRFRTLKRAFESVRLRIENIASTKYESGFVEEDGTVTIRPVDVVGGG
jgi:hypothetical protein